MKTDRQCIQNSNLQINSLTFTGSSCFTNYVQCSGNTSPVPNILTNQVCPLNQYFLISNPNQNSFIGSCANSPPASTCPSKLSTEFFVMPSYIYSKSWSICFLANLRNVQKFYSSWFPLKILRYRVSGIIALDVEYEFRNRKTQFLQPSFF